LQVAVPVFDEVYSKDSGLLDKCKFFDNYFFIPGTRKAIPTQRPILSSNKEAMYTVTLKWWINSADNERSLDLEFIHYGQAMNQYLEWIARYSAIIAGADGDAFMLVKLEQEKDLYCKFEATAA
jgi:hypothetical protein